MYKNQHFQGEKSSFLIFKGSRVFFQANDPILVPNGLQWSSEHHQGGHILILTSPIYHNPLMGELKYKQTKIMQLFKCVTCIEVTYKWWNSWNALDCDSKLLGKYFPKCCMLSNETYETVQTRKVTINSDFWCPFLPSKKHQKIAENW